MCSNHKVNKMYSVTRIKIVLCIRKQSQILEFINKTEKKIKEPSLFVHICVLNKNDFLYITSDQGTLFYVYRNSNVIIHYGYERNSDNFFSTGKTYCYTNSKINSFWNFSLLFISMNEENCADNAHFVV